MDNTLTIEIFNYKDAKEIKHYSNINNFVLTDYITINNIVYLIIETLFDIENSTLKLYVIEDECIYNTNTLSDLLITKRNSLNKLKY